MKQPRNELERWIGTLEGGRVAAATLCQTTPQTIHNWISGKVVLHKWHLKHVFEALSHPDPLDAVDWMRQWYQDNDLRVKKLGAPRKLKPLEG